MSELPEGQCRIEIVAGVDPVLVSLGGEFDLHAAPSLDGALRPLSARRVEIDCSGVTFIDSSGLNVLLGQVKRSRQSGGQVSIIHVPPLVLRVLEITGLMDLLTNPPDDSAAGPDPGIP